MTIFTASNIATKNISFRNSSKEIGTMYVSAKEPVNKRAVLKCLQKKGYRYSNGYAKKSAPALLIYAKRLQNLDITSNSCHYFFKILVEHAITHISDTLIQMSK